MKCVLTQIRLMVIVAIAATQPLVINAKEIETRQNPICAEQSSSETCNTKKATCPAEHVRDMLWEINGIIATIVDRGKAIVDKNNKESLRDHITLFKNSKQLCEINIVATLKTASANQEHQALTLAQEIAELLMSKLEKVCFTLEQNKCVKDPIAFATAVKTPLKELGSVAALQKLYMQLAALYKEVANEAEELVKLEMEQALMELKATIIDLDRQKTPNDLQMVGIIRSLLKRS